MGFIVAVGGGENGWGGSEYELLKADEEIIRLANKPDPVLLFIGFAAPKPDEYFQIVKQIFTKYNCRFIHLDEQACKNGDAPALISQADIVYVGGGSTKMLLSLMREYGLEDHLVSAYERGAVLCGVSAGANCWFSYGNARGIPQKDGTPQSSPVEGLGLLDIVYCPHIVRDPFRHDSMRDFLRTHPEKTGIEIDYAALEIMDGSFRIIPLDDRAKAIKVWWNGSVPEEEMIPRDKFMPIDCLLLKP